MRIQFHTSRFTTVIPHLGWDAVRGQSNHPEIGTLRVIRSDGESRTRVQLREFAYWALTSTPTESLDQLSVASAAHRRQTVKFTSPRSVGVIKAIPAKSKVMGVWSVEAFNASDPIWQSAQMGTIPRVNWDQGGLDDCYREAVMNVDVAGSSADTFERIEMDSRKLCWPHHCIKPEACEQASTLPL
ncbi:hypothetical protein AC578_2224 [Pseudocercospora eumusae]|uniref:Uncharacterized protein n=1 Tax=Pseudocercospora eumusae TaxID=321146 RepID=A0A139HAX6_9PEZI|nr:hypothetical protein AC578_2224 [Pseudocercospora eumusae]